MVRPEILILDVDGVMTSGKMYYTSDGKVMKVFGPDDNDALSLISKFMKIQFVTGDRKGFPISKKRIVDDMHYSLDLVSTIHRLDWILERYSADEVVYMGDGIFDHLVMDGVGYSIAPRNADETAKAHASFVTSRSGGDRAVAEACLHLMEQFFDTDNLSSALNNGLCLSGEWSV